MGIRVIRRMRDAAIQLSAEEMALLDRLHQAAPTSLLEAHSENLRAAQEQGTVPSSAEPREVVFEFEARETLVGASKFAAYELLVAAIGSMSVSEEECPAVQALFERF